MNKSEIKLYSPLLPVKQGLIASIDNILEIEGGGIEREEGERDLFIFKRQRCIEIIGLVTVQIIKL